MRLTVVLQVVQSVTHRLHGNATVPPPGVGDQQEVGLSDATGPGTNGTLPVDLHSDVGHRAAVLEGDGRSVAPPA